MQIRVPSDVTSLTLPGPTVLTPTAGVITVASEATGSRIVQDWARPRIGFQAANPATDEVEVWLPGTPFTVVQLAGVNYNVVNERISAVPRAVATRFVHESTLTGVWRPVTAPATNP